VLPLTVIVPVNINTIPTQTLPLRRAQDRP
jgi:hypothetical protein